MEGTPLFGGLFRSFSAVLQRFCLLVHGVLGPCQASSEAFRMWLGWRLS